MYINLAVVLLVTAMSLPGQAGKQYQASFPVDKSTLGITGNNPNFPLTPGYQLSYSHGKDSEVVTVLAQTKMIDGVECRVVEDREEKDGQLLEVTLDYYALDRLTNDVYYMGENVDVYKEGKVVNHGGTWLSGVNGAKFGMMLPGKPKVGQRFLQEQAPGAMDRIEIKSISAKVTTPTGTFDHCVLVEETSPLEKGVSHKWYASGIGPVKDAEMALVSHRLK